ncbi:N-6 DNA Methylase [Arthrobacter ulcerisalmonis]|uniref:site-specific DNA-methyltransferase (adenine-specific) n=3 Tax=Bacteria TaxID=2 RepID=A0A3P5XHD7_9MICC|nr:N-6 DNA methylase [Arthrobacter ulcerisalmonis]VDC30297.1 N-6 DNA Methylase [Arthrobacter ulcerisalmonis]
MDASTVQEAFSLIEGKRRRWQNEEEVRLAWIRALENALRTDLDAERKREDSSYNNVVIEFKAPGLFQGRKDSAKFVEATEYRLLPYITRKSALSGVPTDDYIGIAIDGDHICFAQVSDGKIASEHLVPFSPYAVELVMAALQADLRRPVTADNLLDDFGHKSDHARSFMQAIADSLAERLRSDENSKIKMLYEEWKTLYGQVADMSRLQVEAVTRELGFSWSGKLADSISARLFVIHTYNSFLVKLLAAEIVSAHQLSSIEHPAQEMAALLDDDKLIKALDDNIERSGIFLQAGIRGFVEEVIFSWYLDVLKDPEYEGGLAHSIRSILATLSLYRTDHLERTRDVLRDVYQGLVPGKLRQTLGEYYTPDWLVDFTMEAAEFPSWLEGRVLDPTCGSGAFLIAAIRRKRQEAQEAGWTAKETLAHLCHSVWGIDLNPLAVQISRVNFLIEIADLLRDAPGESFEVPILLADAIYSPAADPKDPEGVVTYQIGSSYAGLQIELPSKLVMNRQRLDHVFEIMGEEVETGAAFDDVSSKLVSSGSLSPEELDAWSPPLKRTYGRVLDLHNQKWNGIWFRIVRNFFWSATAGEFDLVIGNPPWVRWSKLPDAYRERVKPTCESYGIFSEAGRHGGNELDVSAMITYTVADKWLKVEGRLAFVITGAIFKNPSSSGFRNFVIHPEAADSPHLVPRRIDDFKSLKPFKDASNHTVVAVFDKSSTPGTYPVPYVVWSKPARTTLALEDTLETIRGLITPTMNDAGPVEPLIPGSPWSVLAPGRHEVLRYLAGKCSWVAGRKGITADLNGVYFVPVLQDNGTHVQIASRPNAGRKDLGARRTAWVEPDLLYPLIKGAGDFEAYYLKLSNPQNSAERLYTFVPNTGIQGAHYRQAEQAISAPGLRKTKEWFANFSDLLKDRSTYRRQMKGAPYHAVYNVGDYTFQPWKVVWPEMSSNFYAAVVGTAQVPIAGERPYVPDHKVYFASFDSADVAYYLCGLLNSPVVREWIQSHTVNIQVGDVFKHLTVPEFDHEDATHLELSSLVERAHNEHDPVRRQQLVPEIEDLAERILGAGVLVPEMIA